ncbi:hypothetical protein [Luteimonas sp. SDU101]|uniref:hypothetical protein n=1 Tax=Luteimonas sp. SDU101 TaxID=3422593 RepID=UPI003EC113BE
MDTVIATAVEVARLTAHPTKKMNLTTFSASRCRRSAQELRLLVTGRTYLSDYRQDFGGRLFEAKTPLCDRRLSTALR